MRVAQRLVLGSVLLSMLVIVTGAVGYYASARIGREFDHAVNRKQPVVAALATGRSPAGAGVPAAARRGRPGRGGGGGSPRRPPTAPRRASPRYGPRSGTLVTGMSSS